MLKNIYSRLFFLHINNWGQREAMTWAEVRNEDEIEPELHRNGVNSPGVMT